MLCQSFPSLERNKFDPSFPTLFVLSQRKQKPFCVLRIFGIFHLDHNLPCVGSPWAFNMPHAQGECLVAIYPQHSHRQAEEGERDGAETWTGTDPSDRPWPWGCVGLKRQLCSGCILHCNPGQGGGHLSGRVLSAKQEMCRVGSLGWPWRSGLWEDTGRVEFVSPAITEDKGDKSAFSKYFGARVSWHGANRLDPIALMGFSCPVPCMDQWGTQQARASSTS